MAAPAVSIRGLTVHRGNAAVFTGFDIDFPAGAITGLLGPSGCGKTTLMRAIVGVQRIQSGSVIVLGEGAGSAPLRRRVAYATQEVSVYGDLTVMENLRYFATLAGKPVSAAAEAIEATGLERLTRSMAGELSGGQKRRVSLAAAMVTDPELFILDEPTVGLDPVLRERLWEIFTRLAADGATLLISSHVLDEAMRCDHVVLLREGETLAEDTPGGLLERTGATSPNEAFLTLVESGTGSGSGPVP